MIPYPVCHFLYTFPFAAREQEPCPGFLPFIEILSDNPWSSGSTSLRKGNPAADGSISSRIRKKPLLISFPGQAHPPGFQVGKENPYISHRDRLFFPPDKREGNGRQRGIVNFAVPMFQKACVFFFLGLPSSFFRFRRGESGRRVCVFFLQQKMSSFPQQKLLLIIEIVHDSDLLLFQGLKNVSYICSHFATTGHSACSWHRIYEISLKTLVLNEIRVHSRAVAQDENAVLDKLKQQILSESAAKQEDSRLEISRLRRCIGELEHMTAKLYEDKVSGVINGDTFAVLIQKSEQERIQKAERLEVLLAEERKAQQEMENIRQWAGIVRRYLDVQELDREIVEELIDHIEIGERPVIDGQRHQDIKIFYRFVGVV